MARGRMISKSLSTSEKFAALYPLAKRFAEFCQLLYVMLVTHADDFGRLQGDPFTVKFAVLPGSSRTLPEFTKALSFLHQVGLIDWYEVNGRKYIQISNFDPHQTGLHKRTESSFPDPAPGLSGKFPENPGQGKGSEPKGTEPKRKQPQAKTAAPPPRANDDDEPRAFDGPIPHAKLAQEPNGDNYAVIAKLARELIAAGTADSELVEAVKVQAARHKIDYGRISGAHDVVNRAVASELYKAKHPDLVRG